MKHALLWTWFVGAVAALSVCSEPEFAAQYKA